MAAVLRNINRWTHRVFLLIGEVSLAAMNRRGHHDGHSALLF